MGLKDLFFKSVPEVPADKTQAQSEAGSVSPGIAPRDFPFPGAQQNLELDPGPFLQQLKEAMEKADLPGQQTYLAFSKALSNMEKLPMDEATKFQAAFATLQATGCDAQQLLESFKYFEGILDAEKDKFEEALHATIGDSVIKKENEIKQLTDENADYTAQIQKLTETIAAQQNNIVQLQSELAEVNGKLKQKENSFMSAYRSVKDQLQQDARKINTYLSSAIAAQPSATKHKK
jgi:chromosome segregation ATPase